MPALPPGYVQVAVAAQRAGYSESSFNHWRKDGRGPPYVQIGRKIFYSLADVDAWIARGRVDPEAQRAA